MSYEVFRSEMLVRLQESGVPTDMIDRLAAVVDGMADKFEIEAKPTQLTVVDGIPEVLKNYIVSKSIENLSKKTLDFYYRTIKNFFTVVHKQASQITTNDVRVYLYQYKQTRNTKDSSIETIRIILNGFFQWLVDEDYIDKNPVKRISSIKFHYASRKPLSDLDLEVIRTSCKTLRQKALVDFLFSTGCRLGEMTSMEIRDIDLMSGEVTIRHGKGGKSRVSYLNAESIVSLKAYLASRKDDCSSLFVSQKKPITSMTNGSVEREINKITALSGLNRKVTPHIFRHTAATTALKHGMAIEEVQRFLGHSKLDTTLIYAKVDDSVVKASHHRCVS